jgi:hypothetical protein
MDYWLVETKDGDTGINGGLMPRRNPGQPFMNYIQVDSIDDAMANVVAAGGPSPSLKPKSDRAGASSPPSKTPKETSSASTNPQSLAPDRHQIGCPTSGFSDVGKNSPHTRMSS